LGPLNIQLKNKKNQNCQEENPPAYSDLAQNDHFHFISWSEFKVIGFNAVNDTILF
jgi:hypothetical protein